MSIINDAYRFVVPLLLLAALFAFSPIPWVSFPCILFAAFVCYFFRNPSREIPSGEKLITSPADGKVVKIAPLGEEGPFQGGAAVSIFLNVFDVHVNRAPIKGALEILEYKRGLFKAAYDDEASRVNEQNIITIQGDAMRVVVKQIAGLIARRVVCWKQPGCRMERGELIGLIRFGSRVDMLLPRQVKILVKTGDRVKGGSSIIGDYS